MNYKHVEWAINMLNELWTCSMSCEHVEQIENMMKKWAWLCCFSIDGKYASQGKLGAALLATHSTKDVSSIVFVQEI